MAKIAKERQKELSVHGVSFSEALLLWIKVALLSFGGPAAQIAMMHRLIVEEKRWISERRFMHALNYCMLLPGPEAQQLAIYLGWLLHRIPGGIVAGVLFILPGFVTILALSIFYALYQGMLVADAVFFGLKPAVLAIVIHAVFRISKRVLNNIAMIILAITAFIAIFCFSLPFPVIVLSAAIIGLLGGKYKPEWFSPKMHAVASEALLDKALNQGLMKHTLPSAKRNLILISSFLMLWFVPIIFIAVVLGVHHVLFEQGVFFSKMAVVTFGGAYAVLSYVAQQAVERYGWLRPGEMLDGLGMAETTPGPLIQVIQFVAFMGAFRLVTDMDPLIAAVIAACLATWVTFVPCFLWIFLGAPYVEKLRHNQLLLHAFASVTACVVGVMANLAVWFALHNLFAQQWEWKVLGMQISLPVLTSVDWVSSLLALVAMMALSYFRIGMIWVIICSVFIGAIYVYAR
jgi:chromate transporter